MVVQAWVERQVKAQELQAQEERYWHLKAQESMELREAAAAVKELEIEREVQIDLVRYRMQATATEDAELARAAMYERVVVPHRNVHSNGGPAAVWQGGTVGRPGPHSHRVRGGRVRWDAIDAVPSRTPKPTRGGRYGGRYGQPPPQSHRRRPAAPQHLPSIAHARTRYPEYDDYGGGDAGGPFGDGLY